MSGRKFASTSIRDSEDKLGLTPEQVSQLLADANTTVAKTKGFTQIGDVNYEDGLIFTSLIKLLDAGNDGEEMAGISGIAGEDKDNPAIWAGGTYDQAIGGTANAIIRHDGSGKLGDLLVDIAGMLYTKDPVTGEIKFKINAGNLPSLQTLLGENISNDSVTNSQTDVEFTGTTGFSTGIELPNHLIVEDSGSTITFQSRVFVPGYGFSLHIMLHRNGSFYSTLAQIQSTGSGYYIPVSKTINNCPSGDYSIGLYYTRDNENVLGYATIDTSTLAWQFKVADVQRLEIGLNGLMQYYTEAHWYFTKNGFDLRGKTNMPGVLLSTTVSSTGIFANTWGAKKHASLSASKVSTGTYDIYHSIGHSTYNISANAYGNRTISIVSKSADRCRIQIYNGTTLIDGQFDITLTGNNY